MLEFRTLGSLDLRDSEGFEHHSILSRSKLLALLAYLAIARPIGYHRRDRIIAVLWPDLDQAHARNALRQALHQLREALGHEVFLARGQDELGLDTSVIRCDAIAFQHALADGEPAAALEIYRGDLLPGFHIPEAQAFEEWLQTEREHLRRLAVRAAWTLAEETEQDADGLQAAYWIRRALELQPYDETTLRQAVKLLDRIGDRVGAIQEYEKFRRRLTRELELEPSPETQILIEDIRARVDTQPSEDASGEEDETALAPVAADQANAPADVDVRPAAGTAMAAAPSRYGRVVGLALGIVAVSALVLVLRCPPRPPPEVVPNRIAVFPFPVRGSAEYAYLCEGMVDLLSTFIHGAGELTSVEPHTVLAGGTDGCAGLKPGQARAWAERIRAEFYVLGEILVLGDQLRFSAGLFDAQGNLLTKSQETASSGEEMLQVADHLTRTLVAAVSPARLDSLAAVTTRSLPALRDYLAGQHAVRTGRYDDAVVAFQAAVRRDPEFALAYHGLGEAAAAAWINPGLVLYASQQAVRFSERLSQRDRILLQAALAHRQGAMDEAERRYKAVIGMNRSDAEAWFGLAETQFHYGPLWGRSMMESRDAFEHVLDINPQHVFSLYHRAVIAAVAGELDELDAYVRRGVALNPRSFTTIGMRTLQAFVHRDSIAQDRMIATLSEVGDYGIGLAVGIVAVYSGDIEGAMSLAALLTEPDRTREVRAVGHVVLSHLHLGRGHLTQAREALAAATEVEVHTGLEYRALLAATPFLPTARDEQESLRSALIDWDADAAEPNVAPYIFFSPHEGVHPLLRHYLIGLLSARLGDTPVALRQAEFLERADGPAWTGSLAKDMALEVRAEVAIARGDRAGALEQLSRTRLESWYQVISSSPFFSRARSRFVRAELLHHLGRDDEAIQWYGSFTHISPYDLSYLAASHRRLGQIYESRGERDQAVEHYERFVSLWQDADPELQVWVDEARERLAAR